MIDFIKSLVIFLKPLSSKATTLLVQKIPYLGPDKYDYFLNCLKSRIRISGSS